MLESFKESWRGCLVAASFGAAALVIQTEYIRTVLDVTSGGTVAVGAALSVWLFGIALGALAGKALAARADRTLPALLAGCFLAPFAGLYLIFCLAGLRSMNHIPAGVIVPPGAVLGWSFLACAPFCLLVGITFPLLVRLSPRRTGTAVPEGSSSRIGNLWAAEAAGAFLAGLVFTFVLAGRCSPLTNVAIFSVLPALSGAVFLTGRYQRLLKFCTVSAVVILSTLSVLILGPLFSAVEWRGLGAPGHLIASIWSRYSALKLAEFEGQYSLYDNSEPLLDFPDRYTDLTLAALLLGQNPQASDVLCVGPVSGGLAQVLLDAVPGGVTAVHPDAQLEKLVRGHIPEALRTPLEGGRYFYREADARVWLGQAANGPPARIRAPRPAGWDIIFLDLPGPTRMNSSRYYTPEFFRRAARAAGPAGGLLALRLPYAATFALPAEVDQAASVWAGLQASFSHLALAAGPTEIFLFASDSANLLTQDPAAMQTRLALLEPKVPGLSRYLLDSYYEPDRVVEIRAALEIRSGELAAHTDYTPRAWLEHIRLRLRQSGGQQRGGLEFLLDRLSGAHPYRMIAWPAAVVCLLLFLVWELSGGSNGLGLRLFSSLAVAVTGFAAMGATVILLYVCQLVFGALFRQVALITATFMLALALGSARSAARTATDPSTEGSLTSACLWLCLAVLMLAGLPFLLGVLYERGAPGQVGAEILFYCAVAAVGYFSGALFPRAAAACEMGSEASGASSTAGVLDFADHFGAGCGAALVGILLVPAWGFVPAVLSIVLMLLCIVVFWRLLVSLPGIRD